VQSNSQKGIIMKMEDSLIGRRKFLKKFASNTALLSASAVLATSVYKVSHGRDLAKDELERLSLAYGELDKRTRWTMRGMFVLLGIDLLIFV
jgi:hypothetical protein|tara:strand:- start:1583 stop:1858 length:276 start_codon:yes stop_codon:yes gene_type:complete